MQKPNPTTWIPHGDFKEYYLMWFPNVPENFDHGYVGAIRNIADSDTKILVELDDAWMMENHQRGCCINFGQDYYTLHYFPDYALNGSSMRRDYINRGKIAPAEYAADLFGLLYMEEEKTLSALLKLIRERHKLVDHGDDNALLAWHELRQRRRALRDLHNDEDLIISEIRKTCGLEPGDNI